MAILFQKYFDCLKLQWSLIRFSGVKFLVFLHPLVVDIFGATSGCACSEFASK